MSSAAVDLPDVVVDGCNPSNWDDPDIFTNLRKGGVTVTNATVAIWEGFEDSADEVSKWLKRFRQRSDEIVQIRTVEDIAEAQRSGRAGIILGWQNLAPIENDYERLEIFAEVGVRIVQLAYNLRNLVANGCYERADDGLSKFGVGTVRKLNELGMLIDLSHVGDRSSMEAIELSTSPVAVTHSNRRSFKEGARNKPDDLIRALVDNGGVIGANAFPRFLPREFDSTIEDFLDAIENLVELAGIDHVGIASDFCEGHDMEYWHYLRRLHGKIPGDPPAVPRPDPAISGLDTASDMPAVAHGLRERGYADHEVRKIMGENWVRLYGTVWTQ
ncbi:dipeptidase [Rhodococcoides yunnanense]|uniref:dipeptidase n=1 Tax=Rhodococcoides yunnanense TaxID=278209 RepID=UPI0009347F03|nr:membrane dipeptidase [Rhodococcus yunnanensis]